MSENLDLKIKAIFSMLCKFNSLFSKHQREDELTLKEWARFLATRNITVQQASFALAELIKKAPTFMPNAYEIANVLVPSREPKEYRCEMIINEIQNAIYDTAACRKTNFTDDLPNDTIETITALGGYSVLRLMNFSESYTRSRAAKTAFSVLEKIEAKARNENLTIQGITCVDVKELTVKQVEQIEVKIEKTEKENEKRTSHTLQQVSEFFTEVREKNLGE